MCKTAKKLTLASASPRRRELLRTLVKEFSVQASDIDETQYARETPQAYVRRLAIEKATAVQLQDDPVTRSETLYLGSDTSVVLDNEVLGKPIDRSHALAMLSQLSGRKHHVLSGLAIVGQVGDSSARTPRIESCVVTSAVQFRMLGANEIENYCNSDEPWDKAGAYAIQGDAASFVVAIEGSYTSIVGLPLSQTHELLQVFDFFKDR